MIREELLDNVTRRPGNWDEVVSSFRQIQSEKRALQSEIDVLRAKRNDESKKMASVDKATPEFQQTREALKTLSDTIKEKQVAVDAATDKLRDAHLMIPNAPHESVPKGKGEEDNVELHVWGKKPELSFKPLAHWDLGENLDILDFETAAKISGARFCVLKGDGAKLSRALIAFMLDTHTEAGYLEIAPPALVRRDALVGTGQLPKFEDDVFKVAEDLFLSPTGEVQTTNLHQDDILDGDSLPIRYVAHTPCFRAEAGSYGKDTRGLIRQHQFEKVELVQFVRPENGYQALEELRLQAELILQKLGLHYRVVTLCTGDMSFAGAKTYDIEVWLPAQNTFREISSCTNFEDYQARRAKIRFRPEKGQKAQPVHTINGSGLAVGRTLVAILEQYQQEDGTITVPEVLRPYMGKDAITKR